MVVVWWKWSGGSGGRYGGGNGNGSGGYGGGNGSGGGMGKKKIKEGFTEGFTGSITNRIKFGNWRLKLDNLNPVDISVLNEQQRNIYNQIDKDIKLKLQDKPNRDGIKVEINEGTIETNRLNNTASEETVDGKYYITLIIYGYPLKFKKKTEELYEIENQPFGLVLIYYGGGSNIDTSSPTV